MNVATLRYAGGYLSASCSRLGDAMDAHQVIRSYILENFLFTDDPSVLTDDASFLEQGIIDSVGALEIALFIEEHFGVAVGDQEMLPKNLDSVNNLVAFIESKWKGVSRVPGISPATATFVAG